MNDLGWRTIPIVTVVAFTLMGIEGIADEIEMPFGEHTPESLALINGAGQQGMTPTICPLVSVPRYQRLVVLLTRADVYCDDLKEEVE